ncbi:MULTISPECIES: nickel ABC transporter permease subunit NikB [Dethiosulfovibrio]|uniref:Nickel ABC transporter permease subunit NikB n=2 Tax=Dethiosulfovibrio TaxID=47054 RepID=A0ABS9EUL7_9BACT|nr:MULTISPECIES: nickel ABC transporter permease subunit NikB [Dethiosulfovibrio]MCF4114526.1 nickel ABC transporter permease subunit NikB [Dethiosulfovibrio russensis]MCF4143510.1 nickel ABC transporter permease subunit NikB [Dethiosulfovibrio marinus]MCF4145924.1 nickel ABC transporter permease subunit NikB [Dethiosulfovibrio acidaminovorans]
MIRYISKRVAQLIPLLVIVSIVVFLVLRLGQGDPAMTYLRLSGIPPTDQALATAREELGLNSSLPVQYIRWATKAIHLDFGKSYVTGNPVFPEIIYYMPNTLKLAAFSLALTLAVSLPLGMWAALNRDRLPDHSTRFLAFTGVSMPGFWLAYLLIWLFSIKLKWLPSMGLGGPAHMIMPAISMSLMSICINIRLIRGSVLENLHARWGLYGRLRGLPEKIVIGKHVLVNSLIPIVTAVGMHIGELFGGAVVAETIFSWPGVGRYAVSAIYNRDYPVMQCFILMMTVIFVVMNLAIDILYAWLDPRIRLEGGQS